METKNISQKSAEIEKLLKKGYEEIAAKRWDYAIIVFEKVLSMDKNNVDAANGLIETHRAHANDAIQRENWDEALAVAKTVKSINDEIAFSYYTKLLAINKTKEINRTMLNDIFFAIKHPEKSLHPELTDDYQKMLKYFNQDLAKQLIDLAEKGVYDACCQLIKQGDLVGALAILPFLRGYKDTDEKIKYVSYTLACQDAKNGMLKRASSTFKSLAGYKDAEERFKETTYSYACKLADDENFEEALTEFKSLGEYKDAITRAYLCDSYIRLSNVAQYNQSQYKGKTRDPNKIISSKFQLSTVLRFALVFAFIFAAIFFTCEINHYIATYGFYSFGESYEDTTAVFKCIPRHHTMITLVIFITYTVVNICSSVNIVRKWSYWSDVQDMIDYGPGLALPILFFVGIAAWIYFCIMFVIFFIKTPITSTINFVKYIKTIVAEQKEYIKVKKEISEFEDKLKYLLETMIGDEVETFEREAEGIGFMVGYGKALIEKYSKIQE